MVLSTQYITRFGVGELQVIPCCLQEDQARQIGAVNYTQITLQYSVLIAATFESQSAHRVLHAAVTRSSLVPWLQFPHPDSFSRLPVSRHFFNFSFANLTFSWIQSSQSYLPDIKLFAAPLSIFPHCLGRALALAFTTKKRR